MHKSLIDETSNEDFIDIVRKSYSINDVAEHLGFACSPGSRSRNKMKNRIKSLGLELQKRDSYEKQMQTSNFSSTNALGNVGEASFIMECARNEIELFAPVFEGSSSDFAININDRLIKIQVKTAEFTYNDKTEFNITKGVAYKRGVRLKGRYDLNAFDYFYLYSVKKNEGYLFKNMGGRSVTVNHKSKSKSRQSKNINFAEDHTFSRVIKELLENK